MRFHWVSPILNQPNSRWSWLAPLVSARGHRLFVLNYQEFVFVRPSFPPLPFGWRWLRAADRYAAYRVPVWLYWPAMAWINRWEVLRPLVRCGILTLPEGGYWHEARPGFWNAEWERGWRWVRTGVWT